jgi:hypothetical protein
VLIACRIVLPLLQENAHVAQPIPYSPDALLTRVDAAAALAEAGFPIAPKTLATMATRGGGPAYRTFGKRVLYRRADLIAWAESRLSLPRRSTAEADAQQAA